MGRRPPYQLSSCRIPSLLVNYLKFWFDSWNVLVISCMLTSRKLEILSCGTREFCSFLRYTPGASFGGDCVSIYMMTSKRSWGSSTVSSFPLQRVHAVPPSSRLRLGPSYYSYSLPALRLILTWSSISEVHSHSAG